VAQFSVGANIYTTQYLQGVLGMRPMQAGLAFLPATLVNFAVALAVPDLTRRFGNARLMAAGLAVAVLGMAWLGQVGADTPYLLGVALPMVLIGAGQGATLSPLTVAAVSGVPAEDAGAASGLVNVAHQFGGTLGLGLLVVVFAASGGHSVVPHAELAHQIAASLTASAILLGAALLIVLWLVVRSPAQLKCASAQGR
jgi:sugar phosphate permease